MSSNAVVKVGIVGFGRSGCNIHAKAIAMMPEMYTVTAICDLLPERQTHESFPMARSYDKVESLLADPDVDMVVVATPNLLHARHAIAALRSGKHVLCEKPFGFTTADVDAMIEASRDAGKVLQPFQQRRYEEDFQQVLKICRSGLLGRITFVRIALMRFLRRWDWQTSRQFGGGQLYNNGPHPLDHAMEIFGDAEPEIWSDLRRSLASGDAEDEIQIIMRAQGAPTVQVDLLATAACPHDQWFVCGTAGGLRGSNKYLEWQWVDWTELPERPLDLRPTEGRSYNHEELSWNTDSWKAVGEADAGAGAAPANQPTLDLYANLYRTITEGRSQDITPESVRRRVAVLQKCYELNGIPFPEGTLND